MTIINRTNVIIETMSGIPINPGKTEEVPEMMFDTNVVLSDIGSVVITTEYGKRSFRCFGSLVAREYGEKDDNGMKKVVIVHL